MRCIWCVRAYAVSTCVMARQHTMFHLLHLLIELLLAGAARERPHRLQKLVVAHVAHVRDAVTKGARSLAIPPLLGALAARAILLGWHPDLGALRGQRAVGHTAQLLLAIGRKFPFDLSGGRLRAWRGRPPRPFLSGEHGKGALLRLGHKHPPRTRVFTLRRPRRMVFGVGAKEAAVKEVIGGELEPHEISSLLSQHGYQVHAAIEAFYSNGRAGLPALPKGTEGPANEAMERDGVGSKRARPDKEGGGTSSATASASASLAQNQMLDTLASVTRALEGLPSQLARDLPNMLRAHDEAERHRQQDNGELTELQMRVDNCRTCEEIGRLPGLSFDTKFNVISCGNCQRYHMEYKGTGTTGGTRGKGGEFAGPKANLPRGASDARPFPVVRFAVKTHLGSPMHAWCDIHAAEESRRDESRKHVGLNCGRMVLQGVKEHDSMRSYERRIATEVAMGNPVGTKNHSQEFASKFTDALHDETAQLVQEALQKPDPATGRPRPFALMADKATVARETGQMHGVTVMLGGVLVALMVSVLLCPDATGFGLGTLIVDTLHKSRPLTLTIETLRRGLTGMAFDGQYMSNAEGHASGLQVQSHIVAILGLVASWVTARWDPAHRIELGMNTVREKVKWYGSIAAIVAHANEKYLYGKGYARVKKDAAALKTKLGSVGSVITTRFCASERKVYKSFARNLPILVRDMLGTRAGETGINQEVAAIANVVFVVHLFVVIDLLQHVKNLSLEMQKVNQLPWELEEIIDRTLQLMVALGSDLAKGEVGRMLPPTDRSNGQQVPAFEFLFQNLNDIKQLKLKMYVEQLGSVASIDLQPSAARRASRSAEPADRDVSAEVTRGLSDGAKLAEEIAETLTSRLACPDAETRPLRRMSLCLDLRRMADSPAYATAQEAKPALKFLYDWLCSRMAASPPTPWQQVVAPVPQAMQRQSEDMPPFAEVWKQFELLCTRLQAAFQQHPYNSKWRGVSGTVIQADVFTKAAFTTDCGDYLYLYQQMATKTCCEAVVEGMGSVWDQCTDPVRHPRFEVGAKEAVIAWNAPAAYLPEAEPFVSRALSRHFKGKPWNFTHTDMQLRQKVFNGGSKVVARHRRDALRLPSSMY